jgi:very-short-patch-repair endonuclease
MSAARLGKRTGPRPPHVCAAISAAKRGKPQSAAHRLANGAAHKGQAISGKHRAAITAALKGRPRPPFLAEWRSNIGRTGIGRIPSASSRAKRSESLRRAWAEGRHPVNKSYRYTSLAQRLHAILEADLGITLEPEVRFGRFSVDLYDRRHNVAYEADGRYWHDRNEAKYPGYHAERDAYLLSTFGVITIRYDEKEIAAMTRRAVA